MFDFGKFFANAHFFNIAPGSGFSFYVQGLVLAGILLLGPILVYLLFKAKTKNNPVWMTLAKKINYLLATNGLVLLLLLFFRFENIPYLSIRPLFLVLVLEFVAWAVMIVIWGKKNIKKRLERLRAQKLKQKYLPSTKRK